MSSNANYSQKNVAWLIEFLAYSSGQSDIGIQYEGSDDVIEHPNDKLYWNEASVCNLPQSSEQAKYEIFAKKSQRLRQYEENSPAQIEFFRSVC